MHLFESHALLIEGRLRRRSAGGARCGVPRLRLVTAGLLGRPGAPPAGHYDPAARSSLHGLRRTMPQTEARPTAKNRHGGAPKGARPASWDAGRFASARAHRVMVCPTGCRCTRAPVGAPPTLHGGNLISRPGRNRAAGTNDAVQVRLFEIVRCECGELRLVVPRVPLLQNAPSPLAGEGMYDGETNQTG